MAMGEIYLSANRRLVAESIGTSKLTPRKGGGNSSPQKVRMEAEGVGFKVWRGA